MDLHIIYIPVVLLVGAVAGYVVGVRTARKRLIEQRRRAAE